MTTKEIIRVAKAFTCGVNPNRMLENMTIGKVEDSGPDTKLATTTSSKERTKDKSHPEMMDGYINGRVITKKALMGWAPRSWAASRNKGSTFDKRVVTMAVTYAMEMVACAIVIV